MTTLQKPARQKKPPTPRHASSNDAMPPQTDRDVADSDDSDEVPPKPQRFIYRNEVLGRVGVSYVALWSWVRDGKFPAPVELQGSHQRSRLAWLESEVDAWMASRTRRRPKPKSANAA